MILDRDTLTGDGTNRRLVLCHAMEKSCPHSGGCGQRARKTSHYDATAQELLISDQMGVLRAQGRDGSANSTT